MKAGKMKIEVLRQRLLDVARRHLPGDTVPYAFEKRVLARLAARVSFDPWWVWNRALWRCAAPCVALTLLLGVFTWYGQSEVSTADNFAAELETAICAPIIDSQEVW